MILEKIVLRKRIYLKAGQIDGPDPKLRYRVTASVATDRNANTDLKGKLAEAKYFLKGKKTTIPFSYAGLTAQSRRRDWGNILKLSA